MRAQTWAVAFFMLVLAGCVGTPVRPAEGAVDGAAANPWERGLAEHAATPEFAPTRSKSLRTSEVVPPGAPQFAAFDRVIQSFMASHQIPAASVAVLRDGKLRYQNGHGYLDDAGTRPTAPDAMFRIASITKPMTAAVASMLVKQGYFAWEDPVFCLPPKPATNCRLPIEPHPTRPVADSRLADLKVRDLVDHRTGWTRGPCTAPFFPPETVIGIAKSFGIPSPPPAWRLAQWFMGTPMEFNPGTNPGQGFDTYCNAGYLLLGLVAEAATGTTMAALYEAYLFAPLQLGDDIEPGRTLRENRNPREPFYACDGGKRPNVYRPNESVCWADGGFDMEAALPVGGMISTAAAVGAIYEVFWNDGRVRDANSVTYLNGHTGGLPGTATTAMRFSDGGAGVVGDVQAVVFFNKQTGHELLSGRGVPYEFQRLHSNLLAAYAGAEAGRSPIAV